ncbi:uncharacterized protein BXIN_0009 [Babesia sp. Xinjiang]|uniref:uncharacterized protein n=1 Tax=Babesia sp. Xinjiang TaxID=462227 RepID=UPI000A21AD56|nr:uncharacterized protein BXIN_0009 [Babesia sp. Xinjiang]ORM39809.1 hypothetical protein BXIN_0009 [Babesia sp. Xinjiang]
MTPFLLYALAILHVIVFAWALRGGVSPPQSAFLPLVTVPERRLRPVSSHPFDDAEVRAVNPPVPPPPPRIPAEYVMDDVLSSYRYSNIGSFPGECRHIASLPYVDVRYQDKGSLVPFRDVGEIVSCYSNKLNTLLSNFDEWTAAYNPERKGLRDLSLYNPLSSNSYYAVVFYCAWQSESIALKRAIHQLTGRYSFLRDPAVVYGPKPRERLEDLLAKLDEWERRHAQMIEDARSKGLPDPPAPPLVERERVTMRMRSFNGPETAKILDRLHSRYNFRWWMPHVGQLKYNKVFCRAYNELYNTSYKRVRSDQTRLAYKLRNTGRQVEDNALPAGNTNGLTRINFILVRLANSVMLSNSRRGLQRMRSAAHGHEKEMHFNEIVMRLLLDIGVLYKDMPAIRLFKCTNPVDDIPSVALRKSHKKRPLDPYTPFYHPDPFRIARNTLYGIPLLRKCSHLAIPSDFAFIGGIAGLSNLGDPPMAPELLESTNDTYLGDFRRLLAPADKSCAMTSDDLERLDPIFATLELMYKLNLRQIIDARPVPVTYGYFNP